MSIESEVPGTSPSRAARLRVLVRLPLCPSASPVVPTWRKAGWAFSHTVDPVVE